MSYESATSINLDRYGKLHITSYDSNTYPKTPSRWEVHGDTIDEKIEKLFIAIGEYSLQLLPSAKTTTSLAIRLADDYYKILTGYFFDHNATQYFKPVTDVQRAVEYEATYYHPEDLTDKQKAALHKAVNDYYPIQRIFLRQTMEFFKYVNDRYNWPDILKSKTYQLKSPDISDGKIPFKLFNGSQNSYIKADLREKTFAETYHSDNELSSIENITLYNTKTNDSIQKRDLLLTLSPFTNNTKTEFTLIENGLAATRLELQKKLEKAIENIQDEWRKNNK